MATKAELEAELAKLKAELAERDAALKAKDSSEGEPETEDETLSLETDIGEILAELEEFPHKQPLMFALGAFAVGFLIGRMK